MSEGTATAQALQYILGLQHAYMLEEASNFRELLPALKDWFKAREWYFDKINGVWTAQYRNRERNEEFKTFADMIIFLLDETASE